MDKVLMQWSDLPGNAFKVLMVMAKTAMDDEVEPTYWGGWERLAMAGLACRNWPADADLSDEARLIRGAWLKRVQHAVADAKNAGAVKVKTPGRRGVSACYSLHLDREDLWITRPNEGVRGTETVPLTGTDEGVRGTKTGSIGGRKPSTYQGVRGTKSGQLGGRKPSTRGTNEETREARKQGEETIMSIETPHQRPHAAVDNMKNFRAQERQRLASLTRARARIDP